MPDIKQDVSISLWLSNGSAGEPQDQSQIYLVAGLTAPTA